MKNIIKRIKHEAYLTFRRVFSRYGNIRNYIIFPIAHRKQDKNILKLKGIHPSESCFIIATGPSLRIEDVETISKKYVTFGLNSIYRLFNNTTFRPNYYVALDPDVIKKTMSVDDYTSFANERLFINSMCKKSKYINEKITWLHVNYQNHWLNIFNSRYDYSKHLRYNEDLSKGLYDKYTVTVGAIELAMYMGFKNIYLIGVDCNYNGPAQHVGNDNSDNKSMDEAYMTQKAMMCGFNYIHKIADQKGISIYNATRGGMLEEFPRVKLDNLLLERK